MINYLFSYCSKANPAPVLGCHFPPHEEELFLTFGVQHLCFWRRGKDGYLDRLDAITTVSTTSA